MAAPNFLWLLVMLSWTLEDVKSQQRFPYVSFYGQTLANHAYVDISLVGDDYYSDSVQCITDLSTCCTGREGPHRGDWYFPDGTRLGYGYYNDIYENRGHGRVDLRRSNNPTSPVGIYRCDIPTVAVHDDATSVRDTVYVGLYTASGGMFYNNTGTHKCIRFCRFVYVDLCNNSILMTIVKMALVILSLLCLLWPIVNCQIFPYVSFRGQTLANHSYVDLSEVGSDPSGSDSVQCITDLESCCSSAQCRNYATSPSGVYRCSISTNTVRGHHYNSERESVFVGLYGNNRGC